MGLCCLSTELENLPKYFQGRLSLGALFTLAAGVMTPTLDLL